VSGQATSVLQEQVNGGGWSTIQSGAYTSANITGRGNGTYSYQVQACNAGGCGPWSNVATTTVLFPPPSPGSISVPSTSTGSVAVSWASSATATSYNLYQSVNGGGWTGVFSGSATSATISEGANANYTFGVQACNASGCSGLTTSSAVTVLLPPVAPNAPTVTKTVTQVTNVFVNWNAVATATYYQIEETHPQQGVLPLQNTTGTSATYLMHATGYVKFRIRACNTSGCSDWSGYGQIYVNAP
jgi:predicted phage tail protein